MIRILITKLGLLTGLCFILCFSVYSQPKNPRYWYIPDSLVIQINENGDSIANFGVVCNISNNLLAWNEASSIVELDSFIVLGNGEGISLVFKKNFECKHSTMNHRINYNSDDLTMSLTEGLLFIKQKKYIHVFWGALIGGTGKISRNWGHTIIQIQNDNIQIVKAPYELLTGENTEKCSAVRHVNGRDWWLMFQSFGSGSGAPYKQFLLVENNLYFSRTIATENQNDNLLAGTIGHSCFSADGQHFAAAQQTGQLHIFDFHRYNGNLYNQKTFWLNTKPYGVCFLNNDLIFSSFLEFPRTFLVARIELNNDIIDTLIYEFFPDQNNNMAFSNIIGYSTKNVSILRQNDNKIIFVDSLLQFDTIVGNLPFVQNSTLPNLPNYELGPDLNPGFTTNLPDSVLCVGQTFTVTDTSWGHFRRMWEWGDGTFSDTFAVKQHWELLGLTDTFRTVSHTFTQPGTYNLTLHIINDSSEFGYMDSTVTKTFVVLPWCQTPVIQAHADSICLGQMALSASGDSATYTWTFTNGTASGQNIVHQFATPGWNVFSLNVHKFGVDTTLVDSVFVKDCISADFQTEMISFCDSVIVKIYPQVSKGQIDKITASFQNQSISCLDSCHFTVLADVEENLMLSFENSTDDTSIVKNLKIKLLDCPEFIEIYPNPVSTQLNIHYRLEKPENLRLSNAIGQDVLHIHLEGNGIYSVDVNVLSRGFYHLRLERHPDKKRRLKESWKLVLE